MIDDREFYDLKRRTERLEEDLKSLRKAMRLLAKHITGEEDPRERILSFQSAPENKPRPHRTWP